MRRWRVGTLSLGVLMIVVGVVMLAAQFKQVAVLDMLLRWWPLILVLIGGEVLWHVYTSKEQEPKVKYDVFSIFIIIIMLFSGIGMYALTATGVVEGISWMVQSKTMPVEVPSQRVELDEGVEKVVISAPRERLEIRKTGSREVVIFGQATVKAADIDEAKALVEQYKAVTRREGDTLFVQFPSNTWPGEFKPGIRQIRHTLLLPSDVDVEVSGSSFFTLDIDGETIEKNWVIKGSGNIKITVAGEADLDVDANVPGTGYLGGNVDWEVEEPEAGQADERIMFKGRLKRGEGGGKVVIVIENGEVVVNEL